MVLSAAVVGSLLWTFLDPGIGGGFCCCFLCCKYLGPLKTYRQVIQQDVSKIIGSASYSFEDKDILPDDHPLLLSNVWDWL